MFTLAKQNNDIDTIKQLKNVFSLKDAVEYMEKLDKDPLESAIENNNIDLLKTLIKEGIELKNINIGNFIGTYYSFEFIETLIKAGVNIDAKNVFDETGLLHAASFGDYDQVKLLLDFNADTNIKDSDSNTALRYAVLMEHDDIVTLLLEHGAEVNIADIDGDTPLMIASRQNQKNIVELLIAHGADIDVKNENKQGVNSLMYAIVKNHIEIVELLIDKGVDINNKVADGSTALILASMINNIDMITLLLKHGADMYTQNKKGLNSWIYAVLKNHIEIVELLIEKGMDINDSTANSETALMAAAETNNINIVNLLLQNNAEVNTQDKNGITALMVAVKNDNVDIVKILIENGVNINVSTKDGTSALSLAATGSNVYLVKYLIHKGADIQKSNMLEGNLLFSFAFYHSNSANGLIKYMLNEQNINKSLSVYKEDILNIMTLFFSLGIDINEQNDDGFTILILASMFKDKKLVEYLIEQGVDINIRTKDGLDALTLAYIPTESINYMLGNSNYINNMIKTLEISRDVNILKTYEFNKQDSFDIMNTLIEHGIEVNVPLLWNAILWGNDIEMAELIIENSDVDYCNYYLDTLIQRSSKMINSFMDISNNIQKEIMSVGVKKHSPKTYLQIFKLLIYRKVNLDLKNQKGYTPLMMSVILKDEMMTKALLEHNANPNIKSKTGYTAIDYAYENKSLRRILVKNGAKPSIALSDEKALQKIDIEIENFFKKKIQDWNDPYISEGTILSKALKNKSAEELNEAANKGADFSTINLNDLIKNGYSDTFIDSAIEKGANYNMKDSEGVTPLMHAVKLGKKRVVEILARHGANIDTEDAQGDNVWDYAAFSNQEEILDVLRNYDKISIPDHSPQTLSLLLKKFSKDDRLRYTNHPWDVDKFNHGKLLNYENFMIYITEGWDEIKNDIERLVPSLYKKIDSFLFDENQIGFSSPIIKKALENGEKPENIYLEDDTTFQNKMDDFKGLIVIKQNDKKLKLLKKFIELKKELKLSIRLDLNEIKDDKIKIDKFFTDVDRFKQGLAIILKDIDSNADKDKKDVLIKAEELDDEIIIRIIHKDSKSSKTAQDLTETISDNGGNFKTIYEDFISLCNWSIDTICQDGNRYKIDFLYPEIDNDKPHYQKIDDDIEGFTHILRFYK